MITKIENAKIALEVKSLGSEMTSIVLKSDGSEYLWQGDPAFWPRQAPLMFPICGGMNPKIHRGKPVTLSSHGFGRDYEHRLIAQTADKLVYFLADNEETLKIYPFHFELETSYELAGSRVTVGYKVTNTGDEDMFFSIGSHAGYNRPVGGDKKGGDSYLEFEAAESPVERFVDNGYLVDDNTKLTFEHQKILMMDDEYKWNAHYLSGLKSSYATLKSDNSGKFLTIGFGKFDSLILWSVSPDAPYICLEPCAGLMDIKDTPAGTAAPAEFSQKRGLKKLAPGKQFIIDYYIEIG